MSAAKPRWRSRLVILGAVVAIIAAAVVLRGGGEEAPATPAEQAVVLSPKEITRIAPEDRVRGIQISGSLQPVQRVQLNAKVSGTLATIHVDVGDTVKAGDVLVEFDTKDLRSSLDERRASLRALEAQQDVAQTTLKRTRQLHGQGYTAKSTLDEAESAVLQFQAQIQGVKAQIATAEKAFNDARVLAPFDAVVSTRPIEQGQTLAINTELLTLVDLSRMELVARIPTSRIARVKTGQKAQLTMEGYGARTFEAEVTRISPVAENNARTVPVYLQIDNNDNLLRGGLFASGSLNVETLNGIILLPMSAVREDDEGDYVFTIKDGILTRQSVGIGQSWPEEYRVEITEGLAAGDVVVSAVLPTLKAGMKVTLPETPQDAPSSGETPAP